MPWDGISTFNFTSWLKALDTNQTTNQTNIHHVTIMSDLMQICGKIHLHGLLLAP
jgi:hypothetical protein